MKNYIINFIEILFKLFNISQTLTKEEIIDIIQIIPEEDIDTPYLDSKDKLLVDRGNLFKLNTKIFNLDNDYIVEYITNLTNLRCINYGINTVKMFTVEGIVKKITPYYYHSIYMSASLCAMEVMKYSFDFTEYKNYSYQSELTIEDNEKIQTSKIKELEYSEWDEFVYDKNSTLSEFKEFYEKEFGSEILMILHDGKIIFSSIMRNIKNLPLNLVDIFSSKFKKDIKSQKVDISFMSDSDFDLPIVSLLIK